MIQSQEELPDIYFTISLILSFVTMATYTIFSEYYYLKRLEFTTNSLRININIFKEREKNLLSWAEHFIFKFLSHESDIQKSVASRRAEQVASKKSEGSLSLNDLKLTVENYPKLKADTHISTILNQLEESQSMILNSKLLYNEYVAFYNSTIIGFPAFLFSRKWKLTPLPFYEDSGIEDADISEDQDQTYVQIDLDEDQKYIKIDE